MYHLENIKRVVSWNSTKNPDGTFTGAVFSFEGNNIRICHGRFTRKTRAQAVGAAKRGVRYVKSIQVQEQV